MVEYVCETCGKVFDGNENGPYEADMLSEGPWYHSKCFDFFNVYINGVRPGKIHRKKKGCEEMMEPEEIQRLHEAADRLGNWITELREAVGVENEPAQAMATAAIKREVERCRALLGEIEAEYLPQDIMLDPLVECWHCKAKHLCDPMDATCSKCGAPFDKARCEEFGFKPNFGKEAEG